MKFEGIYTPIVTPFKPDLSIDYDAWGEVIDFQVENGVHGVIVGGSTGEFFSLTDEERVQQFNFAKERLAGRAPMIAGVNHLLVENCLAITAAAKDAGADALLVAAPPYTLPSQKELIAHCLKIDRVADLPILLYNYPGRTGIAMEEDFLDRVSQSRNFCAIKESSGDINRIHMLVREFPQLQLSAGAEDQALEFFAWGAKSWVCVIANFLPREAVAFWDVCVNQGDFAKGRRIMKALLPLMDCLESGGKFLPSTKFACDLMGRPGGPVRPPFQPLKKELQRELREIVNTASHTVNSILSEKD